MLGSYLGMMELWLRHPVDEDPGDGPQKTVGAGLHPAVTTDRTFPRGRGGQRSGNDRPSECYLSHRPKQRPLHTLRVRKSQMPIIGRPDTAYQCPHRPQAVELTTMMDEHCQHLVHRCPSKMCAAVPVPRFISVPLFGPVEVILLEAEMLPKPY